VKRSAARGRGRDRGRAGRGPRTESTHRRVPSAARVCMYCIRKQELRKEACPAYGQTCRRCSKRNHFESVCKQQVKSTTTHHDVHQLYSDENVDELLTLHDADEERWHTRLEIDGLKMRFLLDCGATANLIPGSTVREMGRLKELGPATAKPRMFDGTALQTSGAVTLNVIIRGRGTLTNSTATWRPNTNNRYSGARRAEPWTFYASSTRTSASWDH